jgi:hypothetical protein
MGVDMANSDLNQLLSVEWETELQDILGEDGKR